MPTLWPRPGHEQHAPDHLLVVPLLGIEVVSPADLARALAQSRATVDPHLVFLRYLVETGRINDLMLTDEAGERVPDPGVRRALIEPSADRSPRAIRRGWASR